MYTALAQTAVGLPDVSIPTLYYEIARNGLLGVLFIIAIYALVKRDKDLTQERRERLEDAKSLREMIEASTAARVAQVAASETHNKLADSLSAGQREILKAIAELRNAKHD